jgi:DUF1365 family protein
MRSVPLWSVGFIISAMIIYFCYYQFKEVKPIGCYVKIEYGSYHVYMDLPYQIDEAIFVTYGHQMSDYNDAVDFATNKCPTK